MEALELLEKMKVAEVCPDVLSYSYTMPACVRARKAPPVQPSSEALLAAAERRGNILKGPWTFI